jgi:hypothetical protein
MDWLPLARVRVTIPFLNTGIDYVGPFEINIDNIRRKITTESYVAFFI